MVPPSDIAHPAAGVAGSLPPAGRPKGSGHDGRHGPDDDAPQIVPRRHTGRWLTAGAALLIFAMAVNSVVRNRAFQWDVVGRYFTTAAVLDGLLLTLWLTGVVMVVATLWYIAVTTVLSAGQLRC
ncbi:hypothetical protein [Streptomyces sioyaensis]|uniref:hypothetical protein n=1 Tax=Streptomyces sioyaensis TaxID=67364 RepID=UPI0035ABF70B